MKRLLAFACLLSLATLPLLVRPAIEGGISIHNKTPARKVQTSFRELPAYVAADQAALAQLANRSR